MIGSHGVASEIRLHCCSSTIIYSLTIENGNRVSATSRLVRKGRREAKNDGRSGHIAVGLHRCSKRILVEAADSVSREKATGHSLTRVCCCARPTASSPGKKTQTTASRCAVPWPRKEIEFGFPHLAKKKAKDLLYIALRR